MVGCMDGMRGYVASSACVVVVRESREFASSRRASARERARGGGEGARKDDEVLTDSHGREVCKHKYHFDRFFSRGFWRIYLASFGEEIKAFVEEEIRYASLSVFPLINPSLQEESSC
jgi:hypothetical protein